MLCPREERERLEHYIVGAYGVLADSSRGRLKDEEECSIRTCFQRDIDRITHSKSFRRLKHKTQVFLQPVSSCVLLGAGCLVALPTAAVVKYQC